MTSQRTTPPTAATQLARNAQQPDRPVWIAKNEKQQKVFVGAVVPTLQKYADYLLGKHPLPSPQETIFATLDGFHRWLVEGQQDIPDSKWWYEGGQIIKNAMIAHAITHILAPDQRQALENLRKTPLKPLVSSEPSALPISPASSKTEPTPVKGKMQQGTLF